MSLILEALKKSETRRRLGEAPDIGTPFTVKPRRRNPWPLIVVLIAVAAGVGWWYAGNPPQPKDAGTVVALPSPPAPPPIGKNPANALQAGVPVTKAGPATAARDSTAAQAPPKVDGSAPGMTAKPPARAEGGAAGAAGPGAADSRAPRPISQHLPLPAVPAPATAGAPAAPAAAGQAPTSRVPTPPAAAIAAPPRPTADPASAQPVQPPNIAKAEPDAAAPKPPDAAPPMPTAPAAPPPPAVPQYYELAYAVRKDIPQFNLSMHVFAADPAARFIVVDGDRKAEGDAVKEGLVLREVRTDGIVLEFRGQRFFYPRPGH
jgi:general secretion pathway protein B